MSLVQCGGHTRYICWMKERLTEWGREQFRRCFMVRVNVTEAGLRWQKCCIHFGPQDLNSGEQSRLERFGSHLNRSTEGLIVFEIIKGKNIERKKVEEKSTAK